MCSLILGSTCTNFTKEEEANVYEQYIRMFWTQAEPTPRDKQCENQNPCEVLLKLDALMLDNYSYY